MSDLTAIGPEIDRAWEDVSRQQVLNKALPLKGEYGATKARYLTRWPELPDAASTGKPTAHENAGENDYLRSALGDAGETAALDKIGGDGSNGGDAGLTAREAAGAVRGMFCEPVVMQAQTTLVTLDKGLAMQANIMRNMGF